MYIYRPLATGIQTFKLLSDMTHILSPYHNLYGESESIVQLD